VKPYIVKRTAAVLLAAYAAWMLWLLFGQRTLPDGAYWENVASNCSLVPFRTIREFLQYFCDPTAGSVQIAVVQLFGNVIMFVPLGFLPPLLREGLRTCGKLLLFSVIVIVMIELVQLVTLLGSCDIDDLLLNTVGAALGYVLFRALPKRWYSA